MINLCILVKAVFGVVLTDDSIENALIEAFEGWFAAALAVREQKVLRLFYGIGAERKSAVEIGKDFDVIAERINQIKAKALRKLNGSLKEKSKQTLSVEQLVRSVSGFIQDPHAMHEELARLQERNKMLEEQLDRVVVLLRTTTNEIRQMIAGGRVDLDESIDVLGLTVRSGNCLKADGTFTVRQLNDRSEINLLRSNYLGRKSLIGIKDALAIYGLNLAS